MPLAAYGRRLPDFIEFTALFYGIHHHCQDVLRRCVVIDIEWRLEGYT